MNRKNIKLKKLRLEAKLKDTPKKEPIVSKIEAEPIKKVCGCTTEKCDCFIDWKKLFTNVKDKVVNLFKKIK